MHVDHRQCVLGSCNLPLIDQVVSNKKGDVAIRRFFLWSDDRVNEVNMAAALNHPAEPRRWVTLRDHVENLSIWLVLGLLGLAFSVLAPGHYLPWPAFRQEMIAAFAFIFLAGAAIERTGHVVWPRLALVALATAGIPLLQYSGGLILYRCDAIISAGYLAAFACSLCAGATLARSALHNQVLQGILACFVLVAIVSTGLGLSQWLGPSPWGGLIEGMPAWGRPYANMNQPNNLATQLMLGVAGLLVWFEQRKIGPWIAAAGVAWLGWGIALTQSRTGWLVAAVFAGWWAVMRTRAGLRLKPAAVCCGLALFAAAAISQVPLTELWLGPQPLGPDGSAAPGRLAPGTRWGHWQFLWDALMRSPWFGYGWNQVSNAQFAVANDHPAIREWASHSHNLVLDLLIYNGLPLGLMLCTLLALWFRHRVNECRSPESWCLLLALFALFMHALLEYPLHYLFFLLPAGLMMGFLEGSAPGPKPMFQAPKWTLIVPTFCLAMVAGAIGMEYLKAEESQRDLELTARRIGPAASELPRADWYFVDGWAAYHRAVTVTIDANLSAADYDILKKVAARYTYPNVLERYAHAAAVRGEPLTAQHVLLHSCKVHSRPVCEGMQRRWLTLQKAEPAVQRVHFPSLREEMATTRQ